MQGREEQNWSEEEAGLEQRLHPSLAGSEAEIHLGARGLHLALSHQLVIEQEARL